MASIEFYFDFASPFAYLASCRLPSLAEKYGCELVYRPIDLFAAKVAAGNTGPPTVAIPNKFRYIATDLLRWAEKYGVPFMMPGLDATGSGEPAKKMELPREMLDSSGAHKGVFFARQRGKAREFVDAVFGQTFGAGSFIGDEKVLRNAVAAMGWEPDEFYSFIRSAAADRRYTEANEEAQGRGVFGVPTMIVDEQMWWGNDRLGLLEEYLAAHPAG